MVKTSAPRSLVALAAIAAVGLAGCASAASAVQIAKPVKGGTLTFATFENPQDLNPFTTGDNLSIEIGGSWWDYLIRPTPNGTGLEPELATSWSVSPDARTYTFKIRQGVKFSNGTPITVDDVVWSIDQFLDQPTSAYHYLSPIATVSAPDSSTVRIVLSKPYFNFLGVLSGWTAFILPSKLVQMEGITQYLKDPIGTGPFMFDHWDQGNELVVKRNPFYWQPGKPYLDEIDFKVLTSETARVSAVETGEAQLADDPPLNQLATLRHTSALKVYDVPNYDRIDFIALNTRIKPLNNPLVREAISVALDRKAMVQTALFGNGTPSESFMQGPDTLTGRTSDPSRYPTNITEAKSLLSQAGVGPFTLSFEIFPGVDELGYATVAQSSLAQIGITVNIVTKDANSEYTDFTNGNYQALSQWDTVPSAEDGLNTDFEVDGSSTGCCKALWTGWDDPQAINLVNQYLYTPTRSAAFAAAAQLQTLVAQQAPFIPITDRGEQYLESPRVGGTRH